MKTWMSIHLLVLSIFLPTQGQAQSKTVSESERQIPLSYDVDVIVVGGTLRGVAAAEAAAKQGAKVFLVTDRPYLGEDVCATQRLWVKSDQKPKTELGKSIYGNAEKTNNGYSLVKPMDVKRKLDEALLNNGVPYLYGSYLTEILHDQNGEIAGIVVANRSGRQAIRGKIIIDASDRAFAARIAGADFTPYSAGVQKFKRIIVGGKPNAKAKDLGFKYTVLQKSKKTEKKSYPVYEYDLEIQMKDGSLNLSLKQTELLVIKAIILVRRLILRSFFRFHRTT